jgi:hypothetical protein
MASTRVAGVGVVPSSASEVVAASWNGVRGGGVQLALGGHKGREVACWGQPRLVATSAFFGVGVDRFVLRAVNVRVLVLGFVCEFGDCGFWGWAGFPRRRLVVI